MSEGIRVVYPDVNRWIDELTPELIPARNEDFPGKNVTVLGSFKIWDEIRETREQFRELGFWPVAPNGDEIVESPGTFQILDKDLPKLEIVEQKLNCCLTNFGAGSFLEALFMRAIKVSDFCYVVGADRLDLDDGLYTGTQVSGEIGWASALRKPIYSSGPISPTLDAREGIFSWFGPDAFVQVAEVSQLTAIGA